ncbi:hypothetical protein Tco_1556564 [Tanacetum coccineum]
MPKVYGMSSRMGVGGVSNCLIDFKLLKELQDDELEKSREMMLQSCYVSSVIDRIPVILKGANIFYKNGIHPSYYSITFSLADNVPKQGGIFGDCGVWVCINLYRLAHGVSSYVDDPVDFAQAYREKMVKTHEKGSEMLGLCLLRSLLHGVIAPSLGVDLKGKRVTFPNFFGSPSFKKRKHVVLDEGPSSPKSVPDIAPSDEACKTLFGSLASTEDPGDSDPFLPCIEEARSSHDALCNLSYPDAQALSAEVFRLRGEVEALKDKLDFANQERTSLVRDFFPHAVERLLSSDHLSSALVDLQEKAMLVSRSQALREVASSGIGVELVDMKDFDPNAE